LQLGAINLRKDPPGNLPGSIEINVPYQPKTPFADGVIRPGEYSAPLEIDFTGDVNPGRILKGSKAVINSKDLSAELFTAYTKTDLFIAVRVRDDKLVISPSESIHHGDSVEIFLDGDRQVGDFDKPTPGNGKANHEGFQIGTDVSRRQF